MPVEVIVKLVKLELYSFEEKHFLNQYVSVLNFSEVSDTER